MQNAGFAALGLNWRYLAFEVRPEDLRAALAGARSMQWIGLNLTVPHKLLAVDMVDLLDESARTWGAVNTIRFEGRDGDGAWKPLVEFDNAPPEKIRLQGFNTDADAVVRSLREDLGLELDRARVLLLGAERERQAIETDALAVNPWSAEEPHLYDLEVAVGIDGGAAQAGRGGWPR